MYDLVPDECALQCEKKWLKAMEDEKMKKKTTHGERTSVRKLLFKSMGYKFLLASLFKPVWLVTVVLQVNRPTRKTNSSFEQFPRIAQFHDVSSIFTVSL